MNREVIYAALFDRLKVVADFKTASRRVKSWTEVAAPDQPALFQSQRREQAQTTPGLHTVWLLLVDLYLYANTNGSENVSPGQILNPLVDAVIGALAIDDITKNKCTLGGLVEHAWVEGNIETDEGALGDQGVVIIPIVIKVTGV